MTPDLTVFAKGISNGYPMGAVVGRRQFMEPVANMFISSAYWDDNIGVVAALTTLKELQRRDAIAHFHALGTGLKERFNRAAQEIGVPAECYGVEGHPGIRFQIEDAAAAKKVQPAFTIWGAKTASFNLCNSL